MTSAPAAPGLGRRAVRGAAVTTLAQLIRMVLQIGSVIVLARLLTPRDYGLVAMVLAVIGIAELFRDLGLSPAAVRAEKLSTAQRDNLFWINTGLGAGLAVLVVLASPLLAMAYGRPELTAIAIALAPTFALSGLSTQYRVSLSRDLRFGALAAIDVLCAAVPLLIGVAAALLGAQYWALVIQQVSSGALGLVLLIAVCRWRPRRYDRGAPVASIVRLGLSFVFGTVMAYVTRNADNVIVGNTYGASALGLYTRSVQLVRTPLTQLQAPFGTVALPVMAAAGDDDVRLLSAARRGQVAFIYPVLAGVAVIAACSTAVVDIALGERWLGAAPIMAWVAVSGGLACLGMPSLWIFAARGLGRAITRFNIVATALALAAMGVGVQWGVVGLAAGLAVANLLGWPLGLWFVAKEGRLDIRPLLWPAVRAGVVALIAGVLGRVLVNAVDTSSIAELGLVSASTVLVFCGASVLPACRDDFAEIVSMARLLHRGRSLPGA